MAVYLSRMGIFMARMRLERIKVRRHRVRPHVSHSYKGNVEHVKGYTASGSIQEHREPYPRGHRLGIKMKHHPGYSASYSAEKNARLGHAVAIREHIKMPWLHTEHELIYIGLLERRTHPLASKKFYTAARYARQQHIQTECNSKCRPEV